MFGIDPTPFDVRLVAFRIPVRVHPSFWLGMIFFGWNPGRLDLVFIWVICAFVSILIHELGHAFTAEWFGWPTEIVMYFGGGLAISARYRNHTPGRSIAMSFMGPAAGFMLFGLLIGVHILLIHFQVRINDYLSKTLRILEFMNLYWGLLNLLPVLPLDGGYIFQSLCQMMRVRDPSALASKVGVVVAGAAAYYFFVTTKQEYAGILMLMLCLQNVSSLQSRR